GTPGILKIDDGSSTTFEFSAGAGKKVADDPSTGTTKLIATGTAVITFSVSVSYSPPSPSWIVVDTCDANKCGVNQVTGGDSAGVTVKISVNPTGTQLVKNSPFKATITISGGAGPPVTIVVTLKIQGVDIAPFLTSAFPAVTAGQQSPPNSFRVTVTNNADI